MIIEEVNNWINKRPILLSVLLLLIVRVRINVMSSKYVYTVDRQCNDGRLGSILHLLPLYIFGTLQIALKTYTLHSKSK